MMLPSDVCGKLALPSFIAITCLMPGIVLFSTSIKTVIILELTDPSDENMDEWQQKTYDPLNYDPLTASVRCNGWSVFFE